MGAGTLLSAIIVSKSCRFSHLCRRAVSYSLVRLFKRSATPEHPSHSFPYLREEGGCLATCCYKCQHIFRSSMWSTRSGRASTLPAQVSAQTKHSVDTTNLKRSHVLTHFFRKVGISVPTLGIDQSWLTPSAWPLLRIHYLLWY